MPQISSGCLGLTARARSSLLDVLRGESEDFFLDSLALEVEVCGEDSRCLDAGQAQAEELPP